MYCKHGVTLTGTYSTCVWMHTCRPSNTMLHAGPPRAACLPTTCCLPAHHMLPACAPHSHGYPMLHGQVSLLLLIKLIAAIVRDACHGHGRPGGPGWHPPLLRMHRGTGNQNQNQIQTRLARMRLCGCGSWRMRVCVGVGDNNLLMLVEDARVGVGAGDNNACVG